MARKELVDYIKEVKSQGHDDEVIVDHLKNHGYPEEIIDEAFQELNKKFDIAFFIMIVLVVTGFVLILGLVFLGLRNKLNLGEPDPLCDDVSIAIYEYQDKGIFCNKLEEKLKIQIPLENTGKQEIHALEIKAYGKKNTYKETNENLGFAQSDIFPRVFDYSLENGELEKIEIIPIIKKEERKITCKNKAYLIESIKCE
jgi:hypothetical protein